MRTFLVVPGLVLLALAGCLPGVALFMAEVNRYDKPGATFETKQYDLQRCNMSWQASQQYDVQAGRGGVRACMAAAGYVRKGEDD